MVGGTIGISLYFSQAISTVFYMIAFVAEAFTPAFAWVQAQTSFTPQTWMISVPATAMGLSFLFGKSHKQNQSLVDILEGKSVGILKIKPQDQVMKRNVDYRKIPLYFFPNKGQVKKMVVCTQCIKSGSVVKAP